MAGLTDLAAVMIPIVVNVVFFAFLSVIGWASQREARILGGLITAAIGASSMILLYVLTPVPGLWTAGLIPLSVGAVILLYSLLTPKPT